MSLVFDRIKATAKQRGLSLGKVNELAGLGTNTIYNWKKFKPSSSALSKVARVLGVSADYLLGTDSNSTTDESQDIQKILADVTDGLSSQDGLYFMKNGGKNLSPEEAEMLRSSLENTIRLSKYLAEQRKNDENSSKN